MRASKSCYRTGMSNTAVHSPAVAPSFDILFTAIWRNLSICHIAGNSRTDVHSVKDKVSLARIYLSTWCEHYYLGPFGFAYFGNITLSSCRKSCFSIPSSRKGCSSLHPSGVVSSAMGSWNMSRKTSDSCSK